MKKKPVWTPTLLTLAISALSMPMAAHAALSLSQAPAGSASKEPAPNVIVSVDNSGSMGASGIKALKDALKATFEPGFIADDRIRLAYQSMWGCSGNSKNPSFDPALDNSCGAFVPMASLKGSDTAEDGSHRRKFFKWIETLTYGNNTPTHLMMLNAGEYLKVTGVTSPWNAVPGTADPKPLACRRAYHILMTDGGWNYYDDMPMFNGEFKTATAEISDQHLDNADGTLKLLPDGKTYDPSSAESRVYADPWGRQAVDGLYKWKGANGKYYDTKTQCQNKTYSCIQNTTADWLDIVPTVSDMAFHYWSTDLQPSLKSSDPLQNVIPIIKKSGDQVFTAGGKTQTLTEYWNPINNPATWRHMTTFTIGFNNAATWPTISTDPVFGTNTFDGDFAKLVVGDKKWGNPIQPNIKNPKDWYLNKSYTDKYTNNSVEDPRQQELWHIALNSRGKFYPAKTADDLKTAFGDILKNIVEDTTKPITSYSASSSSVVSSSAYLYRAGYDANGWKGYIESFKIAKGTGAGSANSGWGGATDTTATKLDSGSVTAASRKIYTAKSDTGSVIPFLFDSMHADEKAMFKKTGEPDNTWAKNRIDFLRGERNLEGAAPPSKPFRTRGSRHGDVVNSAVWYIGAPAAGYDLPGYSKFVTDNKSRTPMLYVGANDGMLHGFSALDGTEQIAYVPLGLTKKLIALTEPGYSHQYYVDGSPFTGDVQTSATSWKTMLAGSLGAGGKGYFVLDVTTPGSATDLVVTDKTNSTDADIGHIFGSPVVAEFNPQRSLQIAKMNDDRWALITGNGYNSTNGRPVLLIQYLTGADRSVFKITAASIGANATNNGLSTPRPVDLDGNGTVDIVYAGDLRGNLWKFDVSSKVPTGNWGVAFGGSPLYISKDKTGSPQPITSAPNVRSNKSVGGMMVVFGTGRNVTDGDRTDRTSVQTVYSILDETKYTLDTATGNENKVKAKTSPAPTTVSERTSATAYGDLVPRTFVATNINGEGRSAGEVFWNMSDSQTELKYEGTGSKRGWFLDLPEDGERVLTMPTFYDGSNVLDIRSEVPASGGNIAEESCSQPTLEGKQFQTLMGIEFGLRPTVQLLDSNGDGLFNAAADKDNKTNRHTTDPGKMIKLPGGFKKVTGKETCPTADDCKPEFNAIPKPPLTINWRQLQ